ncbi:unnamed protein product [Dimorphilus gyrociliatus]|uniref:Uncharacterized protein n=1 Tax=Dimorphilus gyrociliatus TaxID=2664684 RepID=A0A7I8W852_9ANNE|nr:unnamed protein product [Dimorphilus gyrociliatus]
MSNETEESGTDAAEERESLNPEPAQSRPPQGNRRRRKKIYYIIVGVIVTILLISVGLLAVYFTLFRKKESKVVTEQDINMKVTTSSTNLTNPTNPTNSTNLKVNSLDQYFLAYMSDERYKDNIFTSRSWTKHFDNVKYYVLVFKNDSSSLLTEASNYRIKVETVVYGKLLFEENLEVVIYFKNIGGRKDKW